jgi:hypothetical protein
MSVSCVALWLALFFTGPAAEPPATQSLSGKDLLIEGDKLADQAKYVEALVRYKDAYEKILPVLRGLKFKESVEPQFMERSALQAHMAKLFREDTTDEEIELMDASLKVFGFVPPEFKTKETLLQLYAEEVAGFYDPKRKQIFLIKETETQKKPGALARLFGAKSGFDKDEQKTTLSHEMAHALADQHFDLSKLEEAAAKDDDRSLALQALIEGEATLVMMIDMQRASGGDVKEMLHASPEAMDASFKLMQGLMPLAAGKTFRTAPPIFRETMLFGYLKGMVFILHLTNQNEWARVDEAFKKPPLSTEQILHPEKYLKEVDEPVAIELPDVSALLGDDWKLLGDNVLGELQISILLRKHWGPRAAAGWDGDRYAVFKGPDGRLGAVWFTTWDSEGDAKEFAGAYARFLGTRLSTPDARPAGKDEPAPPAVPDQFRIEHSGRVYDVIRRGTDVLTIEGFAADQSKKLVGAAIKSEKRAKE